FNREATHNSDHEAASNPNHRDKFLADRIPGVVRWLMFLLFSLFASGRCIMKNVFPKHPGKYLLHLLAVSG
ncbi:MAG TPA: hypothetical protein VJ827_13330, partial [Rubrobacter sp.]|nr:hypothetical protein [Rubrobacter sp.]